MRTIIFQVTPWRNVDVWRQLELTEEQTLHDVHEAIQDVFALDDDHLYAFFLNDCIWDEIYDYGGPRVTHASHEAARTRLDALPLRRNKRLLYLFDFGDELLHEVKVVGEGEAEPAARYPRLVGAHGEAPRQYPVYDDLQGDHDEGPSHDHDHDHGEQGGSSQTQRRLEEVTNLLPALMESLVAYGRRKHPDLHGDLPDVEPRPASERQKEAVRERDAAQALLKASGGDYAVIHEGVEHPLERSVNPWLVDLPRYLSDAGLLADALSLAEQLADVVMGPHLTYDLPLILARAGRAEEARRQRDENVEENPDEPRLLMAAAEASLVLGDLEEAEAYARRSRKWSGSQLEHRRRAVDLLARILEARGRSDEMAAIWREEDDLRVRLNRKRQQRMFGSSQRPFQRTGAKVGRNDPCPCRSGKKYKKCCG